MERSTWGKSPKFPARDRRAGARAGAVADRSRGAIPQRYLVKPGDTVALMDCRNRKCRKPFDPRFPVPRDRLCAQCRAEQAEQTPTLPGMEDLR